MTEEQRKKLAYEAMEARMAQIPKSTIEAKAVEQSPPVEEPLKRPLPIVTVEVPLVQPVIDPPVQHFPSEHQVYPEFEQPIVIDNDPFVSLPDTMPDAVFEKSPRKTNLLAWGIGLAILIVIVEVVYFLVS